MEKQLDTYLRKTISIRGTGVRKEQKQSFYHGVLLGLLRHREGRPLYSNVETGDGFSDILAEDPEAGVGIVIEVKYREDGKLEESCLEAPEQIERLNYTARLENDGMDTILKYGIACNRKKCRVMKEREGFLRSVNPSRKYPSCTPSPSHRPGPCHSGLQ